MLKAIPIIDGVLYQRAIFSDYSLEVKKRFLEFYGIDVVVSLIYADPDMPELVYKYIQNYQPDGKDFDFAYAESLADSLYSLIKEGHRVLVHCRGGKNRSSLLSSLIVMRYFNISGREALDYIRIKKKGAIDTPTLEKYLLSKP